MSCESDCSLKLDLGLQPVSNRFSISPNDDDYWHSLVVFQHAETGLLEIESPVPVNEIKPRYSWLTETEPEKHLGELAEAILELPDIDKNSKIVGISYRDIPLVKQLQKRGLKNVEIIGKNLLGITDKLASIESIQEKLCQQSTLERLEKIWEKIDIVLVTRFLHHVHHDQGFFATLQKLVKPEGYLVFEVPDCTRGLNDFDYSLIFEEHVRYFTEQTFKTYFSSFGLKVIQLSVFQFPIENALAAITKFTNQPKVTLSKAELYEEKNRFHRYVDGFSRCKSLVNEFLSDYRLNRGKIALYGAGHHGCTYINFIKIGKHLEFVVDDNPNKHGKHMPGSSLSIHGPHKMHEVDIRLCITSVSQENEEKVIRKTKELIRNSCEFMSIFPASPYALPVYSKIG